MIKRHAQRVHAKKRFLERTGKVLTTADLVAIVGQIQQGKAKLVRRQSNRVSLWDAEHKGEKVRVIYDRRTKEIVTVLLKEDDDGK